MVRLFAAILLFSGLVAQSQSIRNYSFSPAGSTAQEGNYKILWQIGGITNGASSNQNSTVFQDYFITSELLTITGINASVNSKLICYPNPASDFLNIKHTNDYSRQYQLFDARGNEIKNILIDNFGDIDKLELKGLTNGLYVLNIFLEDLTTPTQVKILKR